MVRHYRRVCDVPVEDIRNIARLLSLSPNEIKAGAPSQEWLQDQARKISKLPEELLRPKDWLGSLKVAIGKFAKRELGYTFDYFIPECAALCPIHEMLNPWIIHKLFILLNHEPTQKLDSVRRYRGPLKTAEVEAFQLRLSGILALYTSPAAFANVVGLNFPREYMPQRIASHCEACILASVGADAQMLCDLRTALMGRSHKHKTPLLLAFVEEWVETFGQDTCDTLLEKSSKMSGRIYAINKKIHDMAKQKKQRSIEKRRERMRRRYERKLEAQNLSASQLRKAKEEIDVKLDAKYGKKSSRSGKHHPSSSKDKSSSTSRGSSSQRETSSSNHTTPSNTRPSSSAQDCKAEEEAYYEGVIEDYMDAREYDETKTELSDFQDTQTVWFHSLLNGIEGREAANDLHPSFRQATWHQAEARTDRREGSSSRHRGEHSGGHSTIAPFAMPCPLSRRRDVSSGAHSTMPSSQGLSRSSSRRSRYHDNDRSSRVSRPSQSFDNKTAPFPTFDDSYGVDEDEFTSEVTSESVARHRTPLRGWRGSSNMEPHDQEPDHPVSRYAGLSSTLSRNDSLYSSVHQATNAAISDNEDGDITHRQATFDDSNTITPERRRYDCDDSDYENCDDESELHPDDSATQIGSHNYEARRITREVRHSQRAIQRASRAPRSEIALYPDGSSNVLAESADAEYARRLAMRYAEDEYAPTVASSQLLMDEERALNVAMALSAATLLADENRRRAAAASEMSRVTDTTQWPAVPGWEAGRFSGVTKQLKR